MAQWHFRKGGTVGYLSALGYGTHKVDAKWEGHSPGDTAVISFRRAALLKGNVGNSYETEIRQSLRVRERQLGRRGSRALAIEVLGVESQPQCVPVCDLMHATASWTSRRPSTRDGSARLMAILYHSVWHTGRKSVWYGYCWSCVAHPRARSANPRGLLSCFVTSFKTFAREQWLNMGQAVLRRWVAPWSKEVSSDPQGEMGRVRHQWGSANPIWKRPLWKFSFLCEMEPPWNGFPSRGAPCLGKHRGKNKNKTFACRWLSGYHAKTWVLTQSWPFVSLFFQVWN